MRVNGTLLAAAPVVSFVPIDLTASTVLISVPSTYANGIAIVTVKPIDCGGNVADGNWDVELTTDGLTTLVGEMTYAGNGCYEQKVAAASVGTSEIRASVAGLELDDGVTLAILDASNLGKVIGLEADATPHSYASVQDAVNSIRDDSLARILVSPGSYDEKVNCNDAVVIEGLSATTPATIRSLEVEECSNVTVRFMTLDAANEGEETLEVEASNNVSFVCCTFRGSKKGEMSILVEKGRNVSFLDCLVTQNGGDGIVVQEGSSVLIKDSKVSSNAWNGVAIHNKATITISGSTIVDNGLAGEAKKGYGIFRKRHSKSLPTDVTLSGNSLAGNRGMVIAGQSTAQVANHDQILDASDSQTSY